MDSCYSVLDGESLLHIEGPDSLKFLQGQTTCDTRRVDAGRAVPGACCTVQGRVVCDFLLVRLGEEHFALRMRRDIRAHAAAVLGKYIVFSKAELDAGRDDWRVVAVWGDAARDRLAAAFGAAPDARYACASGEGFAIVQTDAAGREFECFLAGDVPVDGLGHARAEGDWRSRQIAGGIARIEAATVEAFVPQVLNFDLTGHVSFDKGCYTGQEVVARLHYRGRSKRRGYIARLAAGVEAAPGDALYDDAGHGVGSVVNRCGELAFVTAPEEAVDGGLHLSGAAGPPLDLAPPPYPLAPAAGD